jgi:hypothetical protein
MNGACPPHDELWRLLDGELSENRAAAVRAHVARCPACAAAQAALRARLERIDAPVPGVPSADAVRAVLARAQAGAPAARPRRPSLLLLAAPLVAAAAAALAVVALRSPPEPFTPRGGEVAWVELVGVELWTVEPLRLVEPGARISDAAALVARYRNASAAPAHLLAFGIDGRGEVHWLYPAFLDGRTDPPAVVLPPRSAAPLADGAVLSEVPAGSLQLVTLVSPQPLHVRSIEALPAPERALERLRARFPLARIDALSVDVVPAAR